MVLSFGSERWLRNSDDWLMFMVCDGHGYYGDEISGWITDYYDQLRDKFSAGRQMLLDVSGGAPGYKLAQLCKQMLQTMVSKKRRLKKMMVNGSTICQAVVRGN